MNEAAFFYTYYSQNGGSGIVAGRASDGAEVWRASIGHPNWAPIIVGTTLYACVHQQDQTSQYTLQYTVAVRVTDGHVLWSTELPCSDHIGQAVGVINADATTVAVAAGDNGLYALDAHTGAIRWHVGDLFSDRRPVLSAGVVSALVAHTRFDIPSIAAFRASDGKQLWEAPYGGNNSRVEITSTAAFGFTDFPRHPVALSLHDGHLLWTGAEVGVAIATTPNAVILDTGSHLAALSLANGSRLWQSPVDAGYYQSTYDVVPMVNGVLYVVNEHGVAAVRTSDGVALWHFSDQHNLTESAIVVKGVVYVQRSIAGGQEILALNATTGAVLWHHTLQDAQLLAEPVASN